MATGDGELLVNLLKNTMHALMAVLGQRQVSQHLGESPKLPDHVIPAETSGLQYAGEVNDKVAVKGPELDVLGDFLEVPDAFALSRTFPRSRCLVTYNIFEGQDEASQVTPLNELRQPQVIGVENPQFDLQETEGKRRISRASEFRGVARRRWTSLAPPRNPESSTSRPPEWSSSVVVVACLRNSAALRNTADFGAFFS